jgi:hypothetical protein
MTLLAEQAWYEIALSSKPFWVIIGILVVPVFQFFYPDVREFFTDRLQAKRILSDSIYPVVQAADELYGKILDMAYKDFKGVYNYRLFNRSGKPAVEEAAAAERIYILYLFCCFLGKIAIIRQENNFSKIIYLRRGRRFMTFVKAFETKANNRILDRATQRMIGDAMLKTDKDKLRILNLYEFRTELINPTSYLSDVIAPLDEIFNRSFDKPIRQKVLVFGVLVKSFADYFDQNFWITKNRQRNFIGKLSPGSRRDLQQRVFELYLFFVKEPQKYFSEKKEEMSGEFS